MNISLSSQLEEFVKQKVETGLYSSVSEVIRDGLRLLEERDRLRQMRMEELRQQIREGVDSGEPVPFDLEDTIQRGKARVLKRKASR